MSVSPEARRRELGRDICRELCRAVSVVAPPGEVLAAEDWVWEHVAPSDVSFLEALVEWETSGADEALTHLRESYDAVLDAWRGVAHWHLSSRGRETAS